MISSFLVWGLHLATQLSHSSLFLSATPQLARIGVLSLAVLLTSSLS